MNFANTLDYTHSTKLRSNWSQQFRNRKHHFPVERYREKDSTRRRKGLLMLRLAQGFIRDKPLIAET
jgi:hypothetical protein